MHPVEELNLTDRDRRWAIRLIGIANHVATWSKDRSTKIGAVIARENRILATGYNGFPIGCDDEIDERHERPAKYFWTEHAERNAIFSAAAHGIRLEGADIYLMCDSVCGDCARAIRQVGIRRAFLATAPFEGKGNWGSNVQSGLEILTDATNGPPVKVYRIEV